MTRALAFALAGLAAAAGLAWWLFSGAASGAPDAGGALPEDGGMHLDAATLARAADIPLARADSVIDGLNAMADACELNSPQRWAMVVAQLGHESGSFRYRSEVWGPTAPQLRYEPGSSLARTLGNTDAGDGHTYRGRGWIETTGRANYARASAALGHDFIGSPDDLAQDPWCALSAGLFWTDHNLAAFSDLGDVDACTRVVNGGLNGAQDRRDRYATAMAALVPPTAMEISA